MSEIAKPGRRRLIFDGDGSQYIPDLGKPCSLCGRHMTAEDMPPPVWIRVREKLANGTTREIAHVCPDCVARMFLQVTRLGLWNQVTGTVLAAIKRLFVKLAKKKAGPSADQAWEDMRDIRSRQALGSVPKPKIASRGLNKLLPPKE